MPSARLMIDPPAAGSWNMAMDQALLQSANDAQQMTLRFYQWSEPTLSLGYFQRAEDRQTHTASQACAMVRRSSGGGAILHDHELTYSICVPDSNRWSTASTELYEVVHGQIINLLAEAGVQATLAPAASDSPSANQPFLCFQRQTKGDVLVGGAKICGSAQRRLRNALIQHGSLLLKTSTHAPELPGIEEQTGHLLKPNAVASQLAARLKETMGFDMNREEASDAELELARRTQVERFQSDSWNRKR